MSPFAIEYGELMEDEEYGEAMQRLIPEHMHEGLFRYLMMGKASNPGHFLTAVLRNDLREAFKRADDTNTARMHHWVTFLRLYVPVGALDFDDWEGLE